VKIGRGTVVLVELNPTIGYQRKGVRPCVIVSDPEVTADQRFPLLCVVPITGTAGEGALYPPLAPGRSGLMKPSFALVDHLRSIDKRRLRHVFRRITQAELEAIDAGLCLYLGLDPRAVDFSRT
jgi:mRNA interferase MazF